MNARGDLTEIKSNEEKKGGNIRQEWSFSDFRNFISEMRIGNIRFRGHTITWANNRDKEGFIQDRLDRFFGLAEMDGAI